MKAFYTCSINHGIINYISVKFALTSATVTTTLHPWLDNLYNSYSSHAHSLTLPPNERRRRTLLTVKIRAAIAAHASSANVTKLKIEVFSNFKILKRTFIKKKPHWMCL